METYMERYAADKICVDRGCDKAPGKPCQNCADEDAAVKAARSSMEDIPMVLRPSIPEDFREPPALPPFARCMSDFADPDLPENAGRHAAPFDETTDTMKYLRDLRGTTGARRPF